MRIYRGEITNNENKRSEQNNINNKDDKTQKQKQK